MVNPSFLYFLKDSLHFEHNTTLQKKMQAFFQNH